jgi:hypothetical protein
MKPIDFKESNVTLVGPKALTDLECENLKVYTDGKQCISLWKPSLRERLSILIYGNVWLSVWGGKTQPPIWMDATKTVFNKPPLKVRISIFLLKISSFFNEKG